MPERHDRRLLETFLRVYPARFRRELGADLIETLIERRRVSRSSSLTFWLTDGAHFIADGLLERLSGLGGLKQDLRGALRQVRRAPGFHLVVILTVALGIASSTAMFTVADAVVFRSLPYPEADKLYAVHAYFQGVGDFSSTPLGSLKTVRDGTEAFSWVAAARERSPALTAPGEPLRVTVIDVSERYLEGLGARPVLGRLFEPDDYRADAPPVAVISVPLWRTRFDGDRSAIGSAIDLDGKPLTVIGVVARDFQDPSPVRGGLPTSAWLPIPDDQRRHEHGDYLFTMLARLAPGISFEAAQHEASRIAAAIAESNQEANFDDAPLELVLKPLRELTVGADAQLRVLLLLGASALLLALACVNVANLLLARGEQRQAELATRQALGAGRSRLVRQLLLESLLFSCLGGVVGVVLGSLALRAFQAAAPAGIPRLYEIGLDFRAVFYAGVAVVVTGTAFGALPAWRGARSFAAAMAVRAISSGRRSLRLQSSLVAVQTALALALVTGSALLLTSFQNLVETDPGFDANNLLVVDMRPPELDGGDIERRALYYDELLERISALPGVERAALSFSVPSKPGGASAPMRAEGAPPEEELTFYRVNPTVGDLFRTLGIPLKSGRTFNGSESPGSPAVAVINQEAAEAFFPGTDPIGKHLFYGTREEAPPREVIGVVGNVLQLGAARPPQPEVYFPFSQQPIRQRLLLTLRLDPGIDPPMTAIRNLFAELAPGVPIDDVRTMHEWLDQSIAVERFVTLLVSTFGALALLLAMVGTYSTASYAAARRRREIGIRHALGADRGRLVVAALQRTAAVAAIGMVFGLGITGVASRYLASSLHGLGALDPKTLTISAMLLFGSAVAAALGPAWRAARVDPMRVLGSD